VTLFRPTDRDEIILELRPWITGFITKEYGHVDPNDQADLAQEGCLRLIEIVNALEKKPARFNNKEEYVFYVKACVRNSVRDYILKLRSKFDISLYKLRRQLRENEQELGDFMVAVGDDFAHLAEEEAEDPAEWQTRQQRLSLLSGIRKSGRGMDRDECLHILGEVMVEYKRHLTGEGRWSFQAPPPRLTSIKASDLRDLPSNLPHARTPMISPVLGAARVVKCSNHFCETDLRTVKVPVAYRGYGYCSKSCRKEWPPVVIKLQSQFEAPIEVILEVALKLFRSKRRTAEILNIATSTMDRLAGRYGIREISK
jgi:hypothetical protein